MSRQRQALYTFNRGIISALAIAREDVKRVAMGATVFVNFIARVLGSMALRQGWQYIGGIFSNSPARMLPFIFSTTDTALIELTNNLMRVWVNDSLVTRVAVGSVITNGTFAGNITGWTTYNEGSASTSYSSGYMSMNGDGTSNAIAGQQVTVVSGDIGQEHALRIVIAQGHVRIRIGSTLHADDLFGEQTLDVGTHSLTFVPTGNFFVEFKTFLIYASLIKSCVVESAGTFTLPTPWLTADLGNVRYDQSGDVIFIACAGYQQYRIERFSTHAWSIVIYAPEDGPFNIENVGPVTIASSAITGNVTLTASKPLWYSSHVGALFSVTSIGQFVSAAIGADNTFTNTIRVTGVGTTRSFTISITGTWSATVTLQQSFDNATWIDVNNYTTNQSITYDDGLDNQIVYYQIGIKTGNYTSGTANATLAITTGFIRGIVRITAFSSSTSVSALVLTALGGTTASSTWEEGQWSNYRGWPSAVRFYEGRLWWFGKAGIWGSVSDAYLSFDETVLGDSGVINRTIGTGPVDTINWAIPGLRLLIGAQGSELSAWSDALYNPLTPTSFNMKIVSTQGSAAVEALKLDKVGVFVQRGGIRVYQLAFDVYNSDFSPTDLTALVPELGSPGIVRMVAQRQPDTRIHCVRSDGTVMLGVFDPNESVLCWSNITTSGYVEDAVVLPSLNGKTEDQVYYVVNRTINGGTVRYLEKWAMEVECRGATINKQADSFIIYSGAATNVISGLSYLNGSNVIVWADGKDLSPTVNNVQTTYTVSGGQITLPVVVQNAVIGLPYTAQWQSTKLGETVNGTVLTAKKNMSNLGLVCAYFHPKGLQYGSDFNNLYDMPSVEDGQVIDPDLIRTAYDKEAFFLDGGWTPDMRLCIQAQAPRPVTVMACVCDSDVSL